MSDDDETTELSAEAAKGLREGLVALRAILAKELGREADTGYCEECRRGSSAVPQLSARLKDVLESIAALPPEAEESPVVSLADARDERRRREGLA